MAHRRSTDLPLQARKGVELLLRTVGQAPEQRSSRRLRDRLPMVDADNGPKVLILSPRDWSSIVQYDSVIGHGLQLRGARVTMATCGGGLEICDRANTYEAPPMPCTTCSRYTSVSLGAHGFDVRSLNDYWTDDDGGAWPELDEMTAAELVGAEAEGLPLGQLADIPVKWFLCAANLADDPLAGKTARAFLRSARRIARAMDQLLDDVQPDHVLVLNGLFLFEAILWARCRQRGIDVITYERSFRRETLVMHRGVPAGLYDFSSVWADNDRALESSEAAELDAYLASRREGSAFDQQWSWRPNELTRSGGKLAVLFTNLTWDTAVIGRDLVFEDIEAWVTHAIEFFARRPEDELVVRVHPAEVALPGQRTRDSLYRVIKDRFPDLPPNVRVIAPDDTVTSYPLMDACDVGLVYTSTTGLELALNGKPVLTAGETHYRSKGFTLDPTTVDEFDAMLTAALDDPSGHQADVERARRYAHFFFFRAPIDAPGVAEPAKGLARLTTENPSDLMPGANPGLDRICRGILDGVPFVGPEAPVPTSAVTSAG
ncbi:MAG: hypothetical protein R2733_21780 [Acidimicrobiales bacterium]